MFYKGHRDIAEKTLQHQKAFVTLKMCLKSLAILEKAAKNN
jgi:hypothetical protein